MNWEALAAISEIVGTITIVATLIYVAIQINQNSTMLRTAASQERVQRDFDITSPLIENREVAELWFNGRSDLESLDEVDKHRLMFFQRRAIVHWSSMFELRTLNLLSDPSWNELVWLIHSMNQDQGLRWTWSVFKESFEIPFQEFIEEQFAEDNQKDDYPATTSEES